MNRKDNRFKSLCSSLRIADLVLSWPHLVVCLLGSSTIQSLQNVNFGCHFASIEGKWVATVKDNEF